ETPRAVLHDFDRFVGSLIGPGRAQRTLAFLRFDHIGGLNTAFRCLATGGTLVTVDRHSPEAVCEAIQRYAVEAVPTTPSFLRSLLWSDVLDQADLGSLRVVQYSTEVMPESTLVRLNRRFPNLRLIQAYGMSELGVLRTRTTDRGSTWLETDATVRVRHGVLEVKSNRAMLGYLNGDNPFTADGWFQTGDLVEEVEGRLRILGRAASSINVGGLKVNPVRVEDVLLGVDGVSDALVTGEDNAILGGLVCARIVAAADQEPERLRRRVIDTCKRRLERHELPRRINFVDALQRTENQKKLRRGI
ncbi:MAG: fatty acid--CoA ligase family protein, partial [Myxococcota bacterium]